MNIKSLLIGSAALATASTGALAADAIVVPQPEPMEYVRICDVYGTGFFYIPGTETCLKIGGFYRVDAEYNVKAVGALTYYTRFNVNFDVRSDSEVGTIRGYASLNFDYGWNQRATTPAGAPSPAYQATLAGIDDTYIQIIRGSHSWLFGRTIRPFSRMAGNGLFTLNGGSFGLNRTTEATYAFSGSNGFNFWASIVNDNSVVDFLPDVELGVRFDRGWGSIGATVAYDSDGVAGPGAAAANGAIGAKAWTRVKFGNSGVTGGLMVMYASSAASTYAPTLPVAAGAAPGAGATLSVLAGLQAKFSPKVTGNLHAQWFNTGAIDAAVNLDFAVARGFNVIPEIRYDSAKNIGAVVRLQRGF